jgi:hypothetical protein
MHFVEYLNELGVSPQKYLSIVKRKAKKYGFDFMSLAFSDDKKYKLKILNPETKKYIYFGANGYFDKILYNILFNKKYADKKAFQYHARAFDVYHKSPKYSPSVLSFIILW